MRIALAAALALALSGCSATDSDEGASTQPVTVTETVVRTETVIQEPEPTCSASSLGIALPEQDLPPEAAKVRERVFAAALACDYELLEQIALERGEGFTYSFGDGDSAAAHWRSLEENRLEEPMRLLAMILTLPYARSEGGSYVWPAAFGESPADADWQALVQARLYTQEQVDQMRDELGYLGYRTAITADGDWQFFVAGD